MLAPINCPWGQKALGLYLGDNKEAWLEYDSSELLKKGSKLPILVDQGEADGFLEEQLKPEYLLSSAEKSGTDIEVRMQPGYDHSYFFISTFIDEHLEFHASHLNNNSINRKSPERISLGFLMLFRKLVLDKCKYWRDTKQNTSNNN